MKRPRKRPVTIIDECESDISDPESLHDFTDTSDPESFSSVNDIEEESEQDIEVGSNVLVELQLEERKNKKTLVYYVAKVLKVLRKEILFVMYARKNEKNDGFLFPTDDKPEDKAEIFRTSAKHLPHSLPATTKRQQGILMFNYDFTGLNIR